MTWSWWRRLTTRRTDTSPSRRVIVEQADHFDLHPGATTYQLRIEGFDLHQVRALYTVTSTGIYLDDIYNYSDEAGLGSLLVDTILAREPQHPRTWGAAMVKEGGAVFWERMNETRGITLVDSYGNRLPRRSRLNEALRHPQSSTMRPDHAETAQRMGRGSRDHPEAPA